MRPACGCDLYRRIRRAAAELVNSIRIRSEYGRVPIYTDLRSPLEHVRMMRPGKILLELIQVAVRTENRSARLVVRLKQSVGIRDSRLCVIVRRKERCAADVTD